MGYVLNCGVVTEKILRRNLFDARILGKHRTKGCPETLDVFGFRSHEDIEILSGTWETEQVDGDSAKHDVLDFLSLQCREHAPDCIEIHG